MKKGGTFYAARFEKAAPYLSETYVIPGKPGIVKGGFHMEENRVLEMRGIEKSFPGVRALRGVDFSLNKGEIHALMGENGAGKSTLIKVLTGVYTKDGGRISMQGAEDIHINSPQDAQNAGISTVYQEITLCPNLTVAENMYIGRGKGRITKWKKMNEDVDKILRSLDIPASASQQLASCSIAVQQMVAIARAVDMDCKVLILDEPTSSLDEQEVEKLFKLMRDLKSKGVGIIFVTHFLDQVYEVCDRITVLRDGGLVGEYAIADLPRVELVAKMLGKEMDDLSDIKGAVKMRMTSYSKQKAFNLMQVSNPLTSISKRERSTALPDFLDRDAANAYVRSSELTVYCRAA